MRHIIQSRLIMILRAKYINLSLVWLISLMFLSHALIPHHHHYDSVFEHHQGHDSDKQHSEDDASHCHAFNQLVTIKIQLTSDKYSIQKSLSALASIFSFDEIIIETNTALINQKTPNNKQVFYPDYPTRGSPSFI